MIKKVIISFVLVICLTASMFTATALAVDISGECAILIDADTKEILYEKNPDKQMLIASTTKIITAMVVLDHCKLDENVEMLPEYTAVEGSSTYLKAGDTVTVEELLYGLLLVSGNDAAAALAYHTAGSIEKFASLMNEKAAELGMTNSSFKNPHGLDEDGHYSTARDLALAMAEAIKNETFCKITSTKTITINGNTFKNHNRLLWECEGVMGGKTGYTKSAGRTLVSYAHRDGLNLICVTLKDPDDWKDHTSLYDWAFSEYRAVNITEGGETFAEISVISGTENSVRVKPVSSYRLLLKKDDVVKTETELPKFVYASVSAGATAGKVTVKVNGKTVKTIDLVFSETVEQKKASGNIFRNFLKNNALFSSK